MRGATRRVSPRAAERAGIAHHDDGQPARARDGAEGRVDPLQRQVGVGRPGANGPQRRAGNRKALRGDAERDRGGDPPRSGRDARDRPGIGKGDPDRAGAVGDRSRRRADRHRADKARVRGVDHRDRVAPNGRGRVRGLSRGDSDNRCHPGDEDDGSRSRQPRAPPRRPRWRIRGSAAVLRERLARRRRRQRRVVAEDRLFERTQLRAGLDPELLDERLPAVAVARKRVGLSTVAVEGEHQLPEHLLVERLGRDGALKIGNQLVVATEGEGHVDALRPGGAPLVVEPRRRQSERPPRARRRRAHHLARGRAPRRTPSAPRRARPRRPRRAQCGGAR